MPKVKLRSAEEWLARAAERPRPRNLALTSKGVAYGLELAAGRDVPARAEGTTCPD